MKYGIISDIHSNQTAFEAVLEHMGSVDILWCLGDLVGYGPDPNECIEMLRDFPHVCIVGNHDVAAIGRMDVSDFNPAAALAAMWTSQVLTERSRQYLLSLPERLEIEAFTLVHGSPREPIWEYITHQARAEANFAHFHTQACLVGHTHVPALYVEDIELGTVMGRVPGPGQTITVDGRRFLANPGSVGQPRDGDPRAAYGFFDSDTKVLEWRRVPYDIEATQQRMREHQLPEGLIERLSVGM